MTKGTIKKETVYTAPRIKLWVANEDWQERMKWLNEVSWELQRVRNSAIRALVEKMHRTNRDDLPDKETHPQFYNEEGKITDYNYVYQTRPQGKYKIKNASLTIVDLAENYVRIDFKNYYPEILSGKRRITYYKDQNIPVKSQGSTIWKEGNIVYFQPSSLRYNKEATIFKYNTKDKWAEKDKSALSILEKILDGTYKFCNSKIIKDGKFWYLYLSYSFLPREKPALDFNKIVGVDLGWTVPAYVGLNIGLERQAIGDVKYLERFKTGVRERRRKIQKELNYLGKGSTGHGYKRKTQVLEKLKDTEANFVKTFNHNISKRIIDFAIKNNAGIIHLEQLTKDVKTNSFLTAYWSYFLLQEQIEYKAKEAGVQVVYVYPHYTSQMCSKCGYTHSNNRSTQANFVCINCGHKLNADYNASINIARSREYCATKEESTEGKSKYIKSNGYVFRVDQSNKKYEFTEITGRQLNVNILEKKIDKKETMQDIQEYIDNYFN